MLRITVILCGLLLAGAISVRPQMSAGLSDYAATSRMNALDVRLRVELAGPHNRITSWFPLAFSPDGRTLAVGYQNGSIGLWDVATGQLKKTLSGHRRYVLGLLFSPDGRMLVTGGGDHTARLWDQQSGQLVATLNHAHTVFLMSFSPDSKLLATASFEDKTATIWDGVTGFFVARLPDLTVHYYETIESLTFSPDGQTLATATFQRAFSGT
jgi:WD40 repeat protein